jgi:hypothetical protein
MTYFLLSDAELDAVAGGGDSYTDYIAIYQNSRGGDAVAVGGYSGSATGAASSGTIIVSAVGGAGGTNTIHGPL